MASVENQTSPSQPPPAYSSLDAEDAHNFGVKEGKIAKAEAGVFDGAEGGQSYRTMTRMDALWALLSNQFGIGILSIPGQLRTLGIIPGLIVIVGMGPVAWYGGHLLYQFVCRYPHVAHIVDAVRIVGGRNWEIVAGIVFIILVLMTSAAVTVTMSIALNTISSHALCTIGFIGIACIGCWLACIPRTAKFVALSGIPTFISIISAVLCVMIALGVSGPSQAPDEWQVTIKIYETPSFREVFTACLRIIYAYAGHFGFVSFMAEMKDPKKDFPFALTGLMVCSTTLYAILAIVIYCLAGEFTTSPALGASPILAAKIAYGLAIPAILTGGLCAGHVGIKYVYISFMSIVNWRDQITANTTKAWTSWVTIATVYWILVFIIASAVPLFDSIISICSSTTFAWASYGLGTILWWHLNRGRLFENWKQILFSCINILLFLFTLFLNTAGTWASVMELLDSFNDPNTSVRGCFDCGDNSLFR